jgi:hypothetical protein
MMSGNDMRYDSLFASIIKNSATKLPNNIRIVSWNYDQQFELAFSEYSLIPTALHNLGMLNLTYRQSPTEVRSNEFAIFKLNGTPSILDSFGKNHEFLPKLDVKIKYTKNGTKSDFQISSGKEAYKKLLLAYKKTKDQRIEDFGLTFAWETMNNKFFTSVIQEIKDTDVLVVIGYSFPYFNREIDSEILSCMNPKKIYVQSKEPDEIVNRINVTSDSSLNAEIEIVNDLKQFLIPPELS